MAERGWLSHIRRDEEDGDRKSISYRRPGEEGKGDINLVGGLGKGWRGAKRAAQAIVKNPVVQAGASILNPGVAAVVAATTNARARADAKDPNAGSTADATVNRNTEKPVTPYQQAMADADAEIADLGRRLGAANVGGHFVARGVSEDVADEIRNKHLEQIVLNRLEYSINEHGFVSHEPGVIPGGDDPTELGDRANPWSARGRQQAQELQQDFAIDDPNPSSHEGILQDIEDLVPPDPEHPGTTIPKGSTSDRLAQPDDVELDPFSMEDIEDLDPGEYDPSEETLAYEDTEDVLPKPKPGESPREIQQSREATRLAARNKQTGGGGNHRNIQGALPLSAVPAGHEQELQNGRIRIQGKWYLVVGSALDQYLIPERSGAGNVYLGDQ